MCDCVYLCICVCVSVYIFRLEETLHHPGTFPYFTVTAQPRALERQQLPQQLEPPLSSHILWCTLIPSIRSPKSWLPPTPPLHHMGSPSWGKTEDGPVVQPGLAWACGGHPLLTAVLLRYNLQPGNLPIVINSSVLYLLYGPAFTAVHWENHSLDCTDLCQQSNVSAFHHIVQFVIDFLPRSKRLLRRQNALCCGVLNLYGKF